jgi:FlaA1/EpsC-like NDP-sugar epimerase
VWHEEASPVRQHPFEERIAILTSVIPSLETLAWHSFLGRAPLPSAMPAAVSSLVHGPILITGAGGSIGSALALRLASAGARIILLEASENSLYDLQQNLAAVSSTLDFYLGSVSDRSLLDEILSLHRPRLVLVSTDKAVTPTSMMGATKRLAEQIVLASGGTVLRLGNVLASRGSVTELFARQIAAGRPLTVTDPAARRYFLTITEAVELLLAAASEPQAPALLAPLLPQPHYIADLARFMAGMLAPDRSVAIEFTSLRPGDKECEQLWSQAEIPHPSATTSLVRLHSQLPERSQFQSLLATLHRALQSRDLSNALAAMRALVPDYNPGATILAQCSSTASQVSHD